MRACGRGVHAGPPVLAPLHHTPAEMFLLRVTPSPDLGKDREAWVGRHRERLRAPGRHAHPPQDSPSACLPCLQLLQKIGKRKRTLVFLFFIFYFLFLG